MDYLLILLGFAMLIKGSDFFVDGAASIAARLKIPPMVVGMTIVAIGTSLPEITVSVLSAIKGNTDMAIGNILGSDILNFCIILGLIAVLRPIPVERKFLKQDYLFLFVAEALLVMMGFDFGGGVLTRAEGGLMFVVFLAFIAFQVWKSKGRVSDNGKEEKKMHPALVALAIVGGGVMIKFGGDFVVKAATSLALQFGMSDNMVGLTVVAFGTSLPEIVTSIMAARKGETDIAVGNVVGSNIVNILLALSLTAMVADTPYTMENMFDTAVLVVVSLAVLVFCFTKKSIVRWEGAALLAVYGAYFTFLVNRG